MPYKLKKTRSGKYQVVRADTGRVVSKQKTKSEATAHLRALYANVKH
jgi:hypothetical protein